MAHQVDRKAARKIPKAIKLNADHAEFFLKRARDGKLQFRIGFVARVPKVQGETILPCDYDKCSRPNIKRAANRLRCAGVRLLRSRMHRSPGNDGWHVFYYVAGQWSKWQIIALQGILESDPARAAEDFRRAQCLTNKEFQEYGSILFEKAKIK